jgi:hypothetical protein
MDADNGQESGEVAMHRIIGPKLLDQIMRCEEHNVDEICHSCHKRLHHREPLSINDFVLCQNCSEMFEIVSQSPLKLEKVFEDKPSNIS